MYVYIYTIRYHSISISMLQTFNSYTCLLYSSQKYIQGCIPCRNIRCPYCIKNHSSSDYYSYGGSLFQKFRQHTLQHEILALNVYFCNTNVLLVLSNTLKLKKVDCECIIWWHISAITCQIIMLTCQIFMSSCQIFLLNCHIFMITFHIFRVTCQLSMCKILNLKNVLINAIQITTELSATSTSLSDNSTSLSDKSTSLFDKSTSLSDKMTYHLTSHHNQCCRLVRLL